MTLGTPLDVALSELAIETFLPADSRTGEAMRELMATSDGAVTNLIDAAAPHIRDAPHCFLVGACRDLKSESQLESDLAKGAAFCDHA